MNVNIWSDGTATFAGVYTQHDSRVLYFFTARLTLDEDGSSVSGRISWTRGQGPIDASNYLAGSTYSGEEVVEGDYCAAAGPSALQQITLRGVALDPEDAPLGQDEYIFSIAADGATAHIMSKGVSPGEKSACAVGRCSLCTIARCPVPCEQSLYTPPQAQGPQTHFFLPPLLPLAASTGWTNKMVGLRVANEAAFQGEE
jgi:hypothetical protein